MLFSNEWPALSGRPRLMRFKVSPPSKDLLPGRSKTRNDGSGGLGSSSRAFPEAFLRGKPLGNLIGIQAVLNPLSFLWTSDVYVSRATKGAKASLPWPVGPTQVNDDGQWEFL